MNTRCLWFVLLIGINLALAGCAVNGAAQISPSPTALPRSVALTPYFTRTATITPLPPDPATPTPFPTLTSTPRTHVVKAGEDMYGIALRYGITPDELIAANPEVNPNLMSVGSVLVIPGSAQVLQTSEALPSSTPVAVAMGEVFCYPSAEGGLWCFSAVQNSSGAPLESVTALVHLARADGVQVAARTALTPLNLLPAGASLPLMVYFPAPVPESYQVNVVLQTAFPAQALGERYVPAHVETFQVVHSADGKSVQVDGMIRSEDELRSASQVWVAAVAYNVLGEIIGVRRWESREPLEAVGLLPFTLYVYSLIDPIERVDVFVEAR